MATCETNGHLWGAGDKCVMCKTPKPQEHRSSKEKLRAQLRKLQELWGLAKTAQHGPADFRRAGDALHAQALTLENEIVDALVEPAKNADIAEIISVMESAREHGERCCEDLVQVHVGHISAAIKALKSVRTPDEPTDAPSALSKVMKRLEPGDVPLLPHATDVWRIGGVEFVMYEDVQRLLRERQPVPPDASRWQPIETAPKDNHAILIHCPERRNTYAVTWDSEAGFWRPFGGYISHIADEPSHWMPLPLPPSTKTTTRLCPCDAPYREGYECHDGFLEPNIQCRRLQSSED